MVTRGPGTVAPGGTRTVLTRAAGKFSAFRTQNNNLPHSKEHVGDELLSEYACIRSCFRYLQPLLYLAVILLCITLLNVVGR